MKILSLKKTVMALVSIFILFILLSVIITFHITKKSSFNETTNIDIDIKEENISQNNEENSTELTDEFLCSKYLEKKLVAITFDDGPSEYTKILIDELKKRNIPATFFVLGSEVEKYPDVLKFAHDTGNEIAIHSYEHKLFTKLTENEILEQVSKTKNIINEITNEDPLLIRVPYGSTNKKITKVLEIHDLTSVLWNVDSLDWKFKNTMKTYNYVMKKFKGNDIILMHDTFKTSIEAATLIIDKLQSEDYVFVTVSKFLYIKKLCIEKQSSTLSSKL